MLLPLPVVSTNDVLSHAQSLFNPRKLLQSHFQCCLFIWFILPAAAAATAAAPKPINKNSLTQQNNVYKETINLFGGIKKKVPLNRLSQHIKASGDVIL